MAKNKNTKAKNAKGKKVKKEVTKKIDEMESSTEKNILNVLRVLFAVMVVFAFFYLLTVAIVGKDKEEVEETTIQYEEILAGSSFTMRDDEYLVVYFDFTSEDASSINSAIYSYTSSYEDDKLRVYTVDMSNSFNKKYASEIESNESPENAEDLLINVPTIIRIKDGKVAEYIDDLDDVLAYLG